MPLIKSISGIRGTIGGQPGDNLTPLDILKFTAAYGNFIKNNFANVKVKIVVGRDGRISGPMIKSLVINTLISQGIDVIDLDLATTPTVEVAVINQQAQGGVVITASHNPQGWNALKLLNSQGEFLSVSDGQQVLELAEQKQFIFSPETELGTYALNEDFVQEHLGAIINLPVVDIEAISTKNYRIVVDGINSVGGLVVPELLKLLGVQDIILLNGEPNGQFAHRPEPLAENLEQIMSEVITEKADLGIIVDPDVDRLVFVDEAGELFGEEYTLVAIADYVLNNFESINSFRPGKYTKSTVSNLSSSRALQDITEKHQGLYQASAIGEVHVVELMKKTKAVIGGEGNGGIIYPELHYGRDALVGIALFLTALAKSKQTISDFRKNFPDYFMIKDKIELTGNIDLNLVFNKLKEVYRQQEIFEIDGLKISWPDSWVHLRVSNTEPIIRLYGEAPSINEIRQKIAAVKEIILTNIK